MDRFRPRDYAFCRSSRREAGGGELDASYAGLLERYTRSASPSVKYTAELVNAALAPDPVDRRLVPAQLPAVDNIQAVQQWTRFGVVRVAHGSEPRGQSGYGMLFERRGNRWVFLCVVLRWMS